MNRAQRRAAQRRGEPANALPGTSQPLTINYGHNGTEVIMLFSAPPHDVVALTPEQVDAMARGLLEAKQALLMHLAKEPGNG